MTRVMEISQLFVCAQYCSENVMYPTNLHEGFLSQQQMTTLTAT